LTNVKKLTNGDITYNKEEIHRYWRKQARYKHPDKEGDANEFVQLCVERDLVIAYIDDLETACDKLEFPKEMLYEREEKNALDTLEECWKNCDVSILNRNEFKRYYITLHIHFEVDVENENGGIFSRFFNKIRQFFTPSTTELKKEHLLINDS